MKNGDNVTITLKNGELRYAINDEDLGGFIKVDLCDKREIYLLVQVQRKLNHFFAEIQDALAMKSIWPLLYFELQMKESAKENNIF